ncbi:carboxy terminal-processing peptidase [Flammeovirgaceae bacterium SG7u.111]|nr:carboxy terminal-processing peptidase [Flammeovirgaceae bacterium SG7u.132]WPO36287.1 carboxy terminal-processing peptidase [Flammeovirgaceae bacterium SG7u.111]
MKKKLIFIAVPTVLILIFSFSIFKSGPDGSDKTLVLKDIIFRGLINKAHFNTVELNDDFSRKAFDQYLKRVDGNKHFFIKEDVKKLEQYKDKIDDELNGQPNPLLVTTIGIWDQRVAEAEQYYKEILATPFDFDQDEKVELDGEKREYASSTDELREEWRKYLKYQALLRYYNKIEGQEKEAEAAKKEGKEFTPKTNEALEASVREELLKSYNNYFDRLNKMDHDDKAAEYINAILTLYGPHTEFYPPEEKANFDIDMSGQLEGIGAQLSLIDGEVKVVRIVPGSPSWKKGELKEEDVIMKVGQGDEEPISVMGMPLKDAVKMIRGKKGTEVRLTIKKPDGRITVYSIIRDVVVLEESYAKSAIINHKTSGKKIGVIHLPSFYADFSGKGGRSSSTDVKAELEKLTKHNPDAILIDLRFNGGGSLQDVVDMTGYFIDEGPVVQVNSKLGAPTILKDKSRGVVYDGPLGVMVNHFSASASEILAAALQDYNRAVIIGSESTFGKGTVQRFLELDYYLNSSYSHLKPLGSLKLTIQKFYRITGKSTQWKGVRPDVILPDTYDFIDIGEKSLDFALEYDEIVPQKFTALNDNIDKTVLSAKSQKRVKDNEIFQLTVENAKRLQKQRDKTSQTLNFEEFMVEQKKLEEEAKKFNDLKKVHEDMEVVSVDTFDESSELDKIRKTNMERWYKELKENVYLYESMLVMDDYTNKLSVAQTGAE